MPKPTFSVLHTATNSNTWYASLSLIFLQSFTNKDTDTNIKDDTRLTDVDEMSAEMLTEMSAEMQLLHTLLQLLVDQVTVARGSLVVAAANRPMYPTLHCIRYILEEVDLR